MTETLRPRPGEFINVWTDCPHRYDPVVGGHSIFREVEKERLVEKGFCRCAPRVQDWCMCSLAIWQSNLGGLYNRNYCEVTVRDGLCYLGFQR